MSKPDEAVGLLQKGEWKGVAIAALLEAIRRARRGFKNSSLSTRDLLHTLVRQLDNEHPTVAGEPVTNLPAFAYRFARARLTDRHRKKQVHKKVEDSGNLSPPPAQPESEQEQEDAAIVEAIDWFMTTVDRIERGELPSEIVVPTKKGPARLKLPNPVNVAKTLRGLYVDGEAGKHIALALQVSEGQVAKYKAAGLRYIQILAAKELA
jgi:hypothetical protein